MRHSTPLLVIGTLAIAVPLEHITDKMTDGCEQADQTECAVREPPPADKPDIEVSAAVPALQAVVVSGSVEITPPTGRIDLGYQLGRRQFEMVESLSVSPLLLS